MIRYRAVISGSIAGECYYSPRFHSVAQAWMFALGYAEYMREHMHVRREIEGNAERGEATTEFVAGLATYRVETVQ